MNFRISNQKTYSCDLDQLNYGPLLVEFGMEQLVSTPTRIDKILDVFITNRVDLFSCNVARSVLKSDHFAVYVNCSPDLSTKIDKPISGRRQIKCYNRSDSDILNL